MSRLENQLYKSEELGILWLPLHNIFHFSEFFVEEAENDSERFIRVEGDILLLSDLIGDLTNGPS